MKKVIAHLKSNALHYVMWVIFLGLVITIGFTGTLSKYKSQLNGIGTGNVARFEISILEITQSDIVLNEDNSAGKTAVGEYKFQITSNSECYVEYSIKFSFTKQLDSSISLTMGDKTPTINTDNTEFTFSGFSFTKDGGTNTHTLSITVALMEDEENTDFLTALFSDTITIDVYAEGGIK